MSLSISEIIIQRGGGVVRDDSMAAGRLVCAAIEDALKGRDTDEALRLAAEGKRELKHKLDLPLPKAAEAADVDCVKAFIKLGADAKGSGYNETPLRLAFTGAVACFTTGKLPGATKEEADYWNYLRDTFTPRRGLYVDTMRALREKGASTRDTDAYAEHIYRHVTIAWDWALNKGVPAKDIKDISQMASTIEMFAREALTPTGPEPAWIAKYKPQDPEDAMVKPACMGFKAVALRP